METKKFDTVEEAQSNANIGKWDDSSSSYDIDAASFDDPTFDVPGLYPGTVTQNDVGEHIHLPTSSTPLSCRNISFHPQERFVARLADLLDFANTPLYVLDEVVKIVQEEARNGLDFSSAAIHSRQTFFIEMEKRFNIPEPITTVVGLEGVILPSDPLYSRQKKHTASVTHYDFKNQMADLMGSDDTFGNLLNLPRDITPDNVWSCLPTRADTYVDDVLSASWYRDTYSYIAGIAGDEPFYIYPVIMYVDKTGTDAYQRYGLEPLIFTTAALNRSARNKPSAWRALGFIPDLQISSKASKTKDSATHSGVGRPTRNYHTVLRTILSSFQRCQGIITPVYGHVRIGDQTSYRRLFFPLAYVIGDALSGDRLCGRTGGYTNVARISRSCLCSFAQADDPDHVCRFSVSTKFISASLFLLRAFGLLATDDADHDPPHTKKTAKQKREQYSRARAYLKSRSHHAHINAFFDIWFGLNQLGINGATPCDLMHIFLLGIVPTLLKTYFSGFTAGELAELDTLIDEMHSSLKNSEKYSFPRCSFKKGVTNLALLTADEWIGVVFTVTLVAVSCRGRALFERVTVRQHPAYKDEHDGESVHNVVVRTSAESDADSDSLDDDDSFLSSSSANIRVTERDVESEAGDCDVDDQPDQYGIGDVNAPVLTPTQLVHILEMLLCFHAWYKSETPYNALCPNEKARMKQAVRQLLSTIKTYVPRLIRNGWKLQKFHEMLHVVRDIGMWGSPKNWDASRGEYMLIHFAKRSSKNAQKRDETFVQQVNKRLWEKMMVAKVTTSLRLNRLASSYRNRYINRVSRVTASGNHTTPLASSIAIVSEAVGRPKCFIRIEQRSNHGDNKSRRQRSVANDTPSVFFGWFSTKPTGTLHPTVMSWFAEEYRDSSFSGRISCWTDYRRDGTRFRSNPFFNSRHPWYDWVMVRWSTWDCNRNPDGLGFWEPRYIPAKIMCIFLDPLLGTLHALVHSCEESDHSGDSVTCERWKLEYRSSKKRGGGPRTTHKMVPVLRKVLVDSFGDRVMVVADDPVSRESVVIDGIPQSQSIMGMITVVKPRMDSWSKEFV